MNRNPWELLYALIGILIASAIYWFLARSGAPAPGSAAGYALGVLGFLLMLKAEIVYTLRKKLRSFQWGRTSFWLKAHIVAGLVGPYLILLHSGWRFQGVAGAAAILLLVVVLSGFFGRYIFTAAPRAGGDDTLSAEELAATLTAMENEIAALAGKRGLRVSDPEPPAGLSAVLLWPWHVWRYSRFARQLTRSLRGRDPVRAARLERLLTDKHWLELQWRTWEATRRLLAVWHTLHVPLGGVMFVAAVWHIGGALYYSWRLR